MEGKKRTRRGGGDRASQTPKMRKSCDSCALAKRKCDGKSTCSLCLKRASPCVYSERQKSGPKGVKADDDATACAETTLASATATVATACNTTSAATTADPAHRKSPAKRVRVAPSSSKALKKQATTPQQHKSATTAVGWLAMSASSAKGQQFPPTNEGGSAGAAACAGGSPGVKVNTNATVSVSAATLPPAAPKPSPTISSISPPPRVKPKTGIAPASKEPRPPRQRQARPKQQSRQRASASALPSARARSGAGIVGVASPTATPALSPPRRRTTPQFNSTAAAKIAALPPMMPCGENMTAAAAASRHPSAIELDSGSLGLRGMGVGFGLPSMLHVPPLSDSASSGEGSSRWEGSEVFVTSLEDEALWSSDEFSGDGGRGGLRDEGHHLGVSGSGGGFFYEQPSLAVAASGSRSGIAAWRDVGNGQLPAPHPRPCSPIMVFPGRHASGGGRAHDRYNTARIVEGRGISSPISSWTPEYAEERASTLLAILSSDTECCPSSGATGGGGIGGGGAVAGGGGGLHLPDKRQFMSCPTPTQQQQHHAFASNEGITGASFAGTGGLLPPLTAPAASFVDQRFWNHATGQQRGDARNFPESTTVTTPLDAIPRASGMHLTAF